MAALLGDRSVRRAIPRTRRKERGRTIYTVHAVWRLLCGLFGGGHFHPLIPQGLSFAVQIFKHALPGLLLIIILADIDVVGAVHPATSLETLGGAEELDKSFLPGWKKLRRLRPPICLV